MSHCPNRALTIGFDNPKYNEWIDESVYPIVGDNVIESEHEEHERESYYYHEMFSFFYYL